MTAVPALATAAPSQQPTLEKRTMYQCLYSMREDHRARYSEWPVPPSEEPAPEQIDEATFLQLAQNFLTFSYESCSYDISLIEKKGIPTQEEANRSQELRQASLKAAICLGPQARNTSVDPQIEAMKVLLEQKVSVLKDHDLCMGTLILSTFTHEIGLCLYCCGKFREALKMHQSALTLDESIQGSAHPFLLHSLRTVAHCLNFLEKSSEAFEVYTRIAAIVDNFPEPDPLFKAWTLKKLANCVKNQGKFQEAQLMYEEALKTFASKTGGESFEVGALLMDIGLCIDSMGRLEEALEKFRLARDILAKINRWMERRALMNISNCLNGLYRMDEAVEINLLLLNEYKQLHGEKSMFVACILINLGNCYGHRGEHKKAADVKAQALEIFETFSDEHPLQGFSLIAVCQSLEALGKFQKALPFAERAYKKAVQDFGDEHFQVATALREIGICLYSLGEYEKALSKHQESLALFEALYGNEHYERAICLSLLANCYSALGNNQEARELQQQSLFIRKNVFGAMHSTVAECLINIGSYLSLLGQKEAAAEKYREAHAIRLKLYGKNHPVVAIASSCMELCIRSFDELSIKETTPVKPQLTACDSTNLIAYVREYLHTHAIGSLTIKKNPTGFVRVHLPPPEYLAEKIEVIRVNYWFPAVPIDVIEAPHSHPRYFESIIVQGGYRHSLFRPTNQEVVSTPHRVHRIFKNTAEERNIFCMGVSYLESLGEELVTQGSIVAFPRSLIHQVVQSQPFTLTINSVFRDAPETEYFDIFMPEATHIDPQVERESLLTNEAQEIIAKIKEALK